MCLDVQMASTGATMLLSRIVLENRGEPELNDFEWVCLHLAFAFVIVFVFVLDSIQ
jgi:hypothetical protein